MRAIPGTKRSRFSGFLDKIGISDGMKNCLDVQVKEMENNTAMDLCRIKLNAPGL